MLCYIWRYQGYGDTEIREYTIMWFKGLGFNFDVAPLSKNLLSLFQSTEVPRYRGDKVN